MNDHITYKVQWQKQSLNKIGLNAIATKWLLQTKMMEYEKTEVNLQKAKLNLKSLHDQNLIIVDLRKITMNNFRQILENMQTNLETGYKRVKQKDSFTNTSRYFFSETQGITSDEEENENNSHEINNTTNYSDSNEFNSSKSELEESQNSSTTIFKTADNSAIISECQNESTQIQDVLIKVCKATGNFSETGWSMTSYIDRFESNVKIFQVKDADRLTIFRNLLAGHDINAVLKLDSYKNKTYEQLREFVIMAVDGENKSSWRNAAKKLTTMRSDNYDCLTTFFIEFSKISAQLDDKVPEEMLAEWFIGALPQYAHNHLSTLTVNNVETAFNNAHKIMKAQPQATRVQGAFDRHRGRGGFQGNTRGREEFRGSSGFPGSNYQNDNRSTDSWSQNNNAENRSLIAGGSLGNQREPPRSKNFAVNRSNPVYSETSRVMKGRPNIEPLTLRKVYAKQEIKNEIKNAKRLTRFYNTKQDIKTPKEVKSAQEVKKIMSEPENTKAEFEKEKGHLINNMKNSKVSPIEQASIRTTAVETIKLKLCSFEDNSGVRIKTVTGCDTRRTDHEWVPTVDSGAVISVIDIFTANRMGIRADPSIKVQITMADNSVSKKKAGKAYANRYYFKIPGNSKSVMFQPIIIHTPTPMPGLLGLDLIHRMGGGHFFKKQNGELGFRFNVETGNSVTYKIKAVKQNILQPNSSALIEIEKPAVRFVGKEKPMLIKPLGRPKLFQASSDNNTILGNKVLLTNNSESPVTINKGETVCHGKIEGNHIIKPLLKPKETSELWKKFLNMIDRKTKHIQNPELRKKANKILLARWRLFAEGCGEEIGSANDIILRLNPENLKIEVPSQKRRPYNPMVWNVIRDEIDKLEKSNVIEDCEDPNTSPANLVLVKRKGKIRVCVDYVQMNRHLPSHSQPLPTMREMIDHLQDSDENSFYNQFDVSKCFHNFVIHPDDRKYTAFFGPNSVKQYKQLPFGLCSAPGLIQNYQTKLMSKVSKQLSEKANAGVFLDDGLIHSKGAENALNDLDIVLREYESRNIRLKLEKLELLQKAITFMGVKCEATSNGAKISTTHDSVEAIRKLREPRTVKELRSMLGCFGWLADFLPALNLKLFPFYELLKKTATKKDKRPVKFKDFWTQNHQKYFEEIKRIMPECLCVPDYAEPFEIEVDSSELGHAACIYQISRKNEKRMIQFASKKLPATARNYANDHRETAGIIFALEKFQRFIQLAPKPTIVHTDNRVAAFLKTAKAPKLVRYRLWMNQFNLDLRHKAGSKMHFSDTFSRLIEDDKPYVKDQSDELIHDMEIANVTVEEVQKRRNYDLLGLMQAHFKHHHASAEALHILTGASLADCKIIKDTCFTCLSRDKVKKTHQVPGTLDIKPVKNSLWSIDFVFDQGKIYLSVLDAATKRLFILKTPTKELKHVVKRLSDLFNNFGKPNEIVADLEFLKQPLLNFLYDSEVKIRDITRHSPFLNPVERQHGHLKQIAIRNGVDLEKACVIYNVTPFLDIPKRLNQQWCPLKLYSLNCEKSIQLLREIRDKESKNRRLRRQNIQGSNQERFNRAFSLKQIVRFMVLDEVRFGQVESVNGKLYQIKQLGSEKIFRIHAQELEPVNLHIDVVKYLIN